MLETPRIEYPYQVMFFDTDCAAVVHNLAYLRIIETARTLLASQIGLDMVGMAKESIYPVLLRTEVDYRRSARLSETIIARGHLESIERVRFWMSFDIVSEDRSTTYVTCRQSLALLRMSDSRPQRLPDDWVQRFAHLRQ